MLLAVSASLMGTMCASCSTTERLNKAATTQGNIQAGVNLPPLVADCRKQEPHYAINEGDEARSVIIGERRALGRANARVTRCASFYNDVLKNFGR